MSDVKLHIGTPEDMAKRFLDAVHRAEQGEDVRENHVTFLDLETMLSCLSGKRLELLRHLHQHPARNVADLARTLGRDYKRVYEDVEALAGIGLVERGQTVRATVDEIQASVRL